MDPILINESCDVSFIFNDTWKKLKYMKPRSCIPWNDFIPELTLTYHWFRSVLFRGNKYIEKAIPKGIYNSPSRLVGGDFSNSASREIRFDDERNKGFVRA